MDELDREEFYRLKKVRTHLSILATTGSIVLIFHAQVKNNKQRDAEAGEREAKAKAKRRGSDKENDEGPDSVDVLGDKEDQDVIF